MSEQETSAAVPPAPTQADVEQTLTRARAAMALVEADTNAVAIDSLMTAYVNTAYRRGQTRLCASMMIKVAELMSADMLPLGGVVLRPSTVPPAPRPSEQALPAGYTADDVTQINALVDQLTPALGAQASRVALSALLTLYTQVAERSGEALKAAEHLVAVGGQAIVQHMLQQKAMTDACEPLPAGATLH